MLLNIMMTVVLVTVGPLERSAIRAGVFNWQEVNQKNVIWSNYEKILIKWNSGEFHVEAMWICLFGFYGISISVVYLTPNPFLYQETVLFHTIQFSVSRVYLSKNISI